MEKSKIYKIFSVIINVLYIPLSFFGFLCGMALDGIINETNNTIIVLTNIVAHTGMLMPLLCLVCYFVSKKIIKNRVLCTIVKLIPIILFAIMIVLDFVVQYLR